MNYSQNDIDIEQTYVLTTFERWTIGIIFLPFIIIILTIVLTIVSTRDAIRHIKK